MSGLEKILSVISSEATAEAEKKNAEAKALADSIKAEAEKKAAAEREKILSSAKADAENILERAKSAAALSKRQTLLNTRQLLISKATADALNKMKKLPEKEYFEVIVKLAVSHSENSEGMIRFSKKDSGRLPIGFENTLNEALKQAGKKGASLKIADSTPAVDAGFVLVYGDIEENCDFEALFAEQADELLDVANKALFE